MTQARAPLASDGDHEPSSKLPSLTRENYIRHIVFNRRMANVYRAIDQPGQVRKSKPPVRSSLQLLRWPQFIAQRHSDVNQPVYIRKARKKDGQINAPSCDRLASQDDPTVSVFPSDGDGANSKSFGAVSMQLSTGSRRAFYDIQLREALEQPKSRRRGIITECRGCTLPAAMAPARCTPVARVRVNSQMMICLLA